MAGKRCVNPIAAQAGTHDCPTYEYFPGTRRGEEPACAAIVGTHFFVRSYSLRRAKRGEGVAHQRDRWGISASRVARNMLQDSRLSAPISSRRTEKSHLSAFGGHPPHASRGGGRDLAKRPRC